MNQMSSITTAYEMSVSLQQCTQQYQQQIVRNGETGTFKILDDETQMVLAPFRYLQSLPSKGVRDLLADALNVWYQLPADSLIVIKTIVAYLHDSSLMFDDMEDNSILRRGQPVTHAVFGLGQTMNSATYVLMLAINEVRKLSSVNARDVVVGKPVIAAFSNCLQLEEGVLKMLIGQSTDLSATRLMQCPDEEQYLTSIDNKTGALFQILDNLMSLESGRPPIHETSLFMTTFGRYFQVRDDYLNLVSSEYAGQKGFCEDLDEGKFSLPLIHCLSSNNSATELNGAKRLELQNIFISRNQSATHVISTEMKHRILGILKQRGSLEYTRSRLIQMEGFAQSHISQAEIAFGKQNKLLRDLVEKLAV